MIEVVNLKNVLREIFKNKRSIIITLPPTQPNQTISIKVHDFPNGINRGDRCYIVYQNMIKGWTEINDFNECRFANGNNETNENQHEENELTDKFIELSKNIHPLDKEIPYKDFNGFRYFNLEEYKLQNDIK